jgi:DNA-binding beta-propeller fold protein YncE
MLTSLSIANRKSPAATKTALLSLAVMMFCCGCGTKQGTLFTPPDEAVVWPEFPEQPRIKYVGQLTNEEDLKREVSFVEGLGRALFGREDIGVLTNPYGLALDKEERLFVADTSGSVVHIMDLKTRKYQQFFELADGERLLSPVAVVIAEEDVYVCDSALGKICVFDPQGVYKFSFGSDKLERPAGIAYSHTSGKIYVSDAKRHMIVIFDRQGKFLAELGSRGNARGFFNFPTHLWVDKDGKLYVSDTLNYRIQVFTSYGRVLRTIGKHGDRPGHFAHPCGLATDSFGNIYVGDKQFENIQIFNPQGQILMALGSEGHGPGQFWLPGGIFIDDNNRIFIADPFNKRIQILQLLEGGIQ